jgi:hypothetical protein
MTDQERPPWSTPSVSELDHVIEEWKPKDNGAARPQGSKAPRFPLVKFDDISMATTSFYLVKDLIPSEGLVVIWGPPKCGKSFWAFDLFMHVACGWEYRGLRVKPGAIVCCVLEGQKGCTRRVAAFRKRYPAAKGAPLYLMFTTLDLIHDHKALIASIKAQLPEGVEPAAVLIDTLNRSLVVSENKDEDMAAYLRAADAIRAAFHCVVPVVHHCGHDERRLRGHSSIIGNADTEISIKRDAATPSSRRAMSSSRPSSTACSARPSTRCKPFRRSRLAASSCTCSITNNAQHSTRIAKEEAVDARAEQGDS